MVSFHTAGPVSWWWCLWLGVEAFGRFGGFVMLCGGAGMSDLREKRGILADTCFLYAKVLLGVYTAFRLFLLLL